MNANVNPTGTHEYGIHIGIRIELDTVDVKDRTQSQLNIKKISHK